MPSETGASSRRRPSSHEIRYGVIPGSPFRSWGAAVRDRACPRGTGRSASATLFRGLFLSRLASQGDRLLGGFDRLGELARLGQGRGLRVEYQRHLVVGQLAGSVGQLDRPRLIPQLRVAAGRQDPGSLGALGQSGRIVRASSLCAIACSIWPWRARAMRGRNEASAFSGRSRTASVYCGMAAASLPS